MSTKAARGTKRVCPSCGSKFYDLNRDPVICPICQSLYSGSEVRARVAPGNEIDADDDAVLDAGRNGVEFVPLQEVEETEADDLPDIEGDDIGDNADEEDEAIDSGADDETFLESEDEGDADVSNFVSGGEGEEEPA